MINKRHTGSRYEECAAAFLLSQGFVILAKNYRRKTGEIDLIAQEGRTIVFVEVKGRKDASMGDPAEAVNAAKQQRIRRTAAWFLAERGNPECSCRFDVVAICGDELRLIRDAFS